MGTSALRVRSSSRQQRSHAIPPHAIGGRGNKLVPSNNLLSFIDEREAAEQFSAVVHDFSAGQLAQVARRTKGTAKNWKAGRVFPNGASLLNLAMGIPVVNAWVQAKIGRPAMEFQSPQTVEETLNGLRYAATLPGAAGDEARRILAGQTP